MLLEGDVVFHFVCTLPIRKRSLMEEWTSVSVFQCSNMGSNALYKRRYWSKSDVVASFEDTHESSLGKLVCDLLKILCKPFIVKLINACIARSVNLVVLVCVKTS